MTVGRSPLATSSLGAVGGARGTAAGGLRILIEFLTQYDSTAVKQLKSDLAQLTALEDAAANKEISRANSISAATTRAAKLKAEQTRLISSLSKDPGGASSARAEVKEIQNIGIRTKAGQERLRLLDLELGANGKLLANVNSQYNLEQRLVQLERQRLAFTNQRQAAGEQRQGTQGALAQFQNLKSSVLPRLGGLAAGALGGIFGGALIGVGFAAAQEGLKALEQSLDDIFDPARHARDAITAVGEAINKLDDAFAGGTDRNKAAAEYLRSIGVAADDATVALLAKYGVDVKLQEVLKSQNELTIAAAHADAISEENIKTRTKALIEEASAQHRVVYEKNLANVNGGTVDEAYYRAQAEKDLVQIEKNLAEASRDAARAAYELEQANKAAAAAAQLAAFAEQQMIGAIRAGAQGQIDKLNTSIGAAGAAGPSAKTKALQAQIDKLNNAGNGNASKNAELANIAQERALILLRMKLRLLGTSINLEKYEGKFLLEAINAKLKAIQKEAAAQDRLNRLLDLQYRAAQTFKRNQGESVSDFLERRAKENRDILTEQRNLEREAAQEKLQDLQDKTQDEVALADLAQRRKTALATTGKDNRLKLLQQELQASQKADAAATKAKIAALEKQKKALEDARDKAIEYSTEAKNQQIRDAIEAAKTISELQSLSGEITGLTAAQAFIRALLLSGAVTGPEAKRLSEALSRIQSSLNQYSAKLHNVITHHAVGKGPLEGFAGGGLIPLNNASTPFGSNVRFGEEGTEYGLILQHSIAKTLKGQRGVGQIGPFNVGRTDDRLRDQYMLKKVVKEAVREALS